MTSHLNSPSIYCEPSHHESGPSLLSANIDGLAIPTLVRVPRLDDVGLVDEDVSVQVGRVHPVTGEVLGKTATWLHHLRFHCGNDKI